jgi:hypothetical protein
MFISADRNWMAGDTALQRKFETNIPRKEWRGHSPNLQICVSVSYLYIPTIDLPILLQEICGPGIYTSKSLTDT